jgi:lysophospholipase L1-like esterase
MKWKQLVFGILTAVLGMILVMVAAELSLRAIGFHYDLYLTKLQFGFPNPAEMVERFQPDRDLIWVPKGYPQKINTWIDKHPVIVFMGCSCTELGTYDQCLKDLIDQRHPGNAFKYVNAGVSGWTSYQGLQQLKRDVVRMHPRVITIYYGWNDHWKNFGLEDKDIARFIKSSPTANRLSKFRVAQFLNSLYVRHVLQKGRDPRTRVSLEDFYANLISIVKIARSENITPILLTAPSAHIQGHEPTYLAQQFLSDLSQLVPVHREYAEVVRKVASQENVPLVDLARAFDALPRDFVVNECFHADGIHLKPTGDKIIAETLYRHMEATGLLDSPAERTHRSPPDS